MFAIIDYGASQSFVYASLVRLCDFLTKVLPQKVLVTIPDVNTIIVKDCPIEI